MKCFVLILILIVGSATTSFADDNANSVPDSIPAPISDTGPARLNGTWELDRNLSDSSEPLMKALEVSWAMRQIGRFASIHLELSAVAKTCDTCADEMNIIQTTPIAKDEFRIVLDDVLRPGKDPRGRPTNDRYLYTAKGGVEMNRFFQLPSGSEARLHETRNVEDNPNHMVSTLVAYVDGIEQASINRIYVRASD